MKIQYKLILTAATFLVGMNAAMAASPVGQWNVAFALEPGLSSGATQGICFQSDKTWFSTTFAGWHGSWFQKGDRFRWYGTTGSLSTSEFGAFDSNGTIGGGEFAHASASTGSTSSRGDWHATFAGSSCGAKAGAAQSPSHGDPSRD